MSKDLMFRTSAFGGFKKDDVMDFVSGVLMEKSELERRLAADNANMAQLNSQIAQLQSEAQEIEKLRSELTEKNTQIASYETSLGDKDTLIDELTTRLSDAEVNSEIQAELDEVKAENKKLKEELEKMRDLERQVGAAMLDARVHSEELVEAAKERASNVTKAVYAAIGETAVKIDDLSAGIGEIARNFTKSVEEVELRIKVLTGDMSKTAQALISENVLTDEAVSDTDDTIREYDFSSKGDDASSFEAKDSDIGDEDY